MALDKGFFDTWTPRALATLRIVTAFLFLQHGTAKLRNRGKSVDTSWAIHSACSIHSVRRDGGSVFHGACTSRPFLHASSQPRRGGGSLLLHFLVSIRSRRRRVEYRREPRPQVTDGASLLKLDS